MLRSVMIGCLALWLGAAALGAEPAGAVQVWNVEPWQTVSAGDFSGANPAMKALKPIELLAPRNGVASGFVVLSRDGAAIKGLKASVGDLAQAGGKGSIPAARIQVRFADLARPETSFMPPQRFDRLLEAAPAEVPALAAKPVKGEAKMNFAPKNTAPVAIVPTWVTVRVPADAAPGDYEGRLSLEADGLAATAVPVRVKVYDWQLPEPKDFRVRTIGWTNPEAIAKHYGVELWSEKHFELMGRSMERMLELGSRQLIIDVTRYYPSRDNADTMIKWIKQPDGSYKYDFTLFDRYCDLAEKKLGKPFPVRLNMWRGPRNGGGGESTDYPHSRVLVLDPGTKEVTELMGPTKLGSEEMKAFWKPVMDEIRVRLEKRGWMDVAGPNWMCYCGGMTKELASMMKSIWPDVRGLDVTHGRQLKYPTLDGSIVPVFVQSTVWNEGTLDPYKKWTAGPYPRQYAGRFQPGIAHCTHGRCQYRERSWPSLWTLHTKHEEALMKGNDGLECVGADHFPIKDAKGRWRDGDWSAFAQGPENATLAILGAGDAGPLGTERFEAMREGIQLCEAMIFIQKALEAKKLSGDLEARANKVLDDRAKAMVAAIKEAGPESPSVWDLPAYAGGAARRDGELYTLAAEVAKATGGK
ncbi:MAG TPA: hypothetical protein PK280_06835 [Planctomycetota bacterium]|nr:hypothetical protein [Planctomycetota bacterium]